MEILIVLLLISILWWLAFIILSNNKSNNSSEFDKFHLKISRDISDELNKNFVSIMKENRDNEKILKDDLEKFLLDTDKKIEKNLKDNSNIITEKFDSLNKTTKDSLENISDKVDKKLEKWFEKTNETFSKIIERLAKIDEAQKNIDKLSWEVVSLQNVLTDNKTRGIFWEIQLHSILQNIFWEKNDKMYEMEFEFKQTKTRVDSVVKTPQGYICIDSKFPLWYYEKMVDKSLSEEERNKAKKDFVSTIKSEVNSISSKYIIKDVTMEQAFMFIPAEAIFADINAYFYKEIIEYAHSKNVSIVSPTTLMAMLTIVATSIRSLETQKQAQIIQVELSKLWTEFWRFETRWNKFTKDFKSVGKDIDDIDVTNRKIISRFSSVENLELEDWWENKIIW